MAAVWITIGTFVLVMLVIAGVWKLRNKVLDPIGPADVSGEAWAYLGCVAAFLTGVASSWLAQGVHARPDVSLLWLWAGLVVGGALAPFVISPIARKIREEQDRRAMADDGIIPRPGESTLVGLSHWQHILFSGSLACSSSQASSLRFKFAWKVLDSAV